MKFRERMTFANIMSVLALIVAVAGTGGGVAYAHHGKITSNEIKNNAVKSMHIKNGQVKSKDIKNNNVKSKDIKNGTVRGNDLARRIDGVAMAGAHVDRGGNVTASFNRLGGGVSAKKRLDLHTEGFYEVTIPGATGDLEDKILSVTGELDGLAGSAYCQPAGGPTGSSVVIVCFHSSSGDLVDAGFNITLVN